MSQLKLQLDFTELRKIYGWHRSRTRTQQRDEPRHRNGRGTHTASHGPRLYHKKSRMGCMRCKTRRVKVISLSLFRLVRDYERSSLLLESPLTSTSLFKYRLKYLSTYKRPGQQQLSGPSCQQSPTPPYLTGGSPAAPSSSTPLVTSSSSSSQSGNIVGENQVRGI